MLSPFIDVQTKAQSGQSVPKVLRWEVQGRDVKPRAAPDLQHVPVAHLCRALL